MSRLVAGAASRRVRRVVVHACTVGEEQCHVHGQIGCRTVVCIVVDLCFAEYRFIVSKEFYVLFSRRIFRILCNDAFVVLRHMIDAGKRYLADFRTVSFFKKTRFHFGDFIAGIFRIGTCERNRPSRFIRFKRAG